MKPETTIEDIGGLDLIKAYLTMTKDLFTPKAKAFGLKTPKAILALGQPGCGKSLTAKTAGAIYNLPTLRISAGALMDSLVGGTEKNWRQSFAIAKSMAPIIVHVDECESLFIGAESSGKTDGGTSGRLAKQILEDLQENSDKDYGILWIFTANDIDTMPDPFIDRCDVWSFELPTMAERRDIWRIHIKKNGRDPGQYDLDLLAARSDGYSGRQIEAAFLKAMQRAFFHKRDVIEEDAIVSLNEMVATSITMATAINIRRERLKNRAHPASRPDDTGNGPRQVVTG
jgi:SpoVK/Ycf46/Vps4 family AAA+-type ATPase